MSAKKNIREFDLNGLKEYFETIGDKRFRAMQVYEWLWKKNARTFDEMSNLSLELREKLNQEFVINTITVDATQHSNDGTFKIRFKTADGHLIEGVLIPTEKRFTACVSSQVGCSLTCAFCATGKMDRKRNLGFDEIYDQVAILNEQCQEKFGKNLSNIVYMGMGEPLLNYKNVLKSVERITSPEAMNMSPNRITVSTAGVSKMIKQLGDDAVKFNLAVSLHAPTDGQRTEIMPINESNNLKILIDSLQYFHQKTKNEITLEYILFNEVNDSLEDAENLVKIYRQVPTHLINVIEYNPIEGVTFLKPNEERTNAFTDYLIKHKINVRVRRSRGKDIDAACGQLANKG
jgi:23S rRNA (adenine2503-C2)-methyltransferase